jgi:hypothetical protein
MKTTTFAIRPAFSLAAVVLFASVFGLACAGELDPRFDQTGGGGTGGMVVACDAPTKIFVSQCGTAACHSASGAGNAGLDLATVSGMAQRLVNVKPAGGNGSSCSSDATQGARNYLDPGSSANPSGLLIDKLKPSPPCGIIMPFGVALSTDDLSCVTSWAASVTK